MPVGVLDGVIGRALTYICTQHTLSPDTAVFGLQTFWQGWSLSKYPSDPTGTQTHWVRSALLHRCRLG